MPEPLFSVIIPTYGRPAFLAEAIASVLAQTVEDFECLLVDDASPDPPEAPVDARVRVVRRISNGGPSAARNTGLEHARGRYVAFLDDDDVFTPVRLALALEGLARAPVSICLVRFLHQAMRGPPCRTLEGNVADTILDHFTPSLGATAVRRESATRFDERLDNVEDVDWWRRTAAELPVSTVAQVGLLYRLHHGARHRTGAEARARANVSYLAEHGDYFSSHPRAAAFRWKRVGLLAHSVGDESLARAAFARSLRIRAQPATAWHLARSLGRSVTNLLPRPERETAAR